MPKNRATHEENCLKICLLCFGKTKEMIPITETWEKRLVNVCKYDRNDDSLPKAICSACKRNLYRAKSNPSQKIKVKDLAELKPLRMETRGYSSEQCECGVCQLAQKTKYRQFCKR